MAWNIWVPIAIAALVSGLLATSVTLYFQHRRALKERKIDCLRRVVGYRSMPPVPAWTSAMNEICVTFNNSTPVMTALALFERGIRTTGGHANELLLDLIKAMMKDTGMSRTQIDDEFLLRPFQPAPQIQPANAQRSN